MTPRISRSLLERMRMIVAADPMHEVCGLLLGEGEDIRAIVEARNVAPEPRISFEIDPRVLIDTHKATRAGGLPIIGSYHSHPSGVARPSAWDLEMAHEDELWLIFAGQDVTAWRRGPGEFQQLSLEAE